VAGFIQSYRSIIPESISGPNAGAKFEHLDFLWSKNFLTGTYLGITGQILNSEVNRMVGAFRYVPAFPPVPATLSGLRENLNYHEPSLLVTANQLIGVDCPWASPIALPRHV
jgi:hypothetical protein